MIVVSDFRSDDSSPGSPTSTKQSSSQNLDRYVDDKILITPISSARSSTNRLEGSPHVPVDSASFTEDMNRLSVSAALSRNENFEGFSPIPNTLSPLRHTLKYDSRLRS